MYYAKIKRKPKESKLPSAPSLPHLDYVITISEDPPTEDERAELVEVLQDSDEAVLHEKVTRYIENELKSQSMIT